VPADSTCTAPGRAVNALSAQALAEVGVDITDRTPQQVTDEMVRAADLVVVLGRDARLEPVDDTPVEVWDTDEPSERGIEGLERMRLVRSDLHDRVLELARRLHVAQPGEAPAPSRTDPHAAG
jgi:arsenate-mycothiol transferase